MSPDPDAFQGTTARIAAHIDRLEHQVVRLRAQNAALLEALEELLADVEGAALKKPTGITMTAVSDSAAQKARAAIAQAKEQPDG